MSAEPGWYDDGQHPGRLRYWDGEAWTDRFSEPAARRLVDAEPDPDHRPRHAPAPRRSPWAWLAPLVILAGGAATLLVLWLSDSLRWAPSPLG